MTRRIALLAAVALVVSATAYGLQKPPRSTNKGESASKADLAQARSQYFAAQASLYSALSSAEAMEKILEVSDDPDTDLVRSLISTINRTVQGTSNSTVKIGQAVHEIERHEGMKSVRSELDEVMKANDDAHAATDGHGPIGPHAKNVQAHLLNAMVALAKLAEPLDVRPLRPPGASAYAEAKSEKREK